MNNMKAGQNRSKNNKVMHKVMIQFAADKTLAPKPSQLRKWAQAALHHHELGTCSLTIRIVAEDEMTELNFSYRNKRKPTNVLSFPFTLPADVPLAIPILGDLAICARVVNEEAKQQHKTLDAHWAHMVIHGVLHLLGHDHEIEAEANAMEAIETTLMQQLGYANPYQVD